MRHCRLYSFILTPRTSSMFIVYSILEASTVSGSLVWWLIWSVKIKFPFFLCTVLWRKGGHVGKAQHVHSLTCRSMCLVNFHAAVTLLSEKNTLAPTGYEVGWARCDKINKEIVELMVPSYSVHRAQFIECLCFWSVNFATHLQYQLSWLRIFCLSLVLPCQKPHTRPWVLPSTPQNLSIANYTSFDVT